ncbi:MAG: prepilin-type N-terminal cleavage/methylation domain-containing protein [Elusimicrobiaceae bacterium]|nr:prepilin-type N-terminal cleavage/methylation domain-containing protein [Elusimicrobiaceae bacterium]
MNNRGFTLIELLVVVLIIGVLVAVALPQYQKAVLKSRFSSLMPLAKALSDSEEIYYMNHGMYTDDDAKLDITSNNVEADITLGNEDQHKYVLLTRSDIKNNLVMYHKHSSNFAGETHCEAEQGDDLSNWLCKDSLKGTLVGNKYGYTIYSLSAQSTGTLDRAYQDQNGLFLSQGDSCTATQRSQCKNLEVDGGSCKAQVSVYGGSSCSGTFTNQAVCEGAGGTQYTCEGAHFSNGSVCKGYSTYLCQSASFDNSSCEVYGGGYLWGSYGCNGARFTNQSTCRANVSLACNGARFTDHSVCYANVKGACPGATYDETSYCVGQCPAGARKENGTLWQVDEDGNSY